ncbi:type II secretion system F family protein [Actinokineospora sp. HUAS TT18]|uniref:type II secretion system F family protein n=1 Tax=Actinokineospora sp. HUAS TT18 TaxID=3447451 RepID=UPI003F51DFC3
MAVTLAAVGWLAAGPSGAIAATLIAITAWRQLQHRRQAEENLAATAGLSEALRSLVAELRAGAHPAQAAESAATDAHPTAANTLRTAATALRLGTDLDAALSSPQADPSPTRETPDPIRPKVRRAPRRRAQPVRLPVHIPDLPHLFAPNHRRPAPAATVPSPELHTVDHAEPTPDPVSDHPRPSPSDTRALVMTPSAEAETRSAADDVTPAAPAHLTPEPPHTTTTRTPVASLLTATRNAFVPSPWRAGRPQEPDLVTRTPRSATVDLATFVRPKLDPGHSARATLTRAWRLATRHGLALADVLDATRADLDHQVRFGRQVRARMAGPRASALMLAVLPVLALLLGESMGAAPIAVLTNTPVGQTLLIVGVALICAGVSWTTRLIGKATR